MSSKAATALAPAPRCHNELPQSFAEMRTLLLSAILYLLGVAGILYLRPALMFHPDGNWKEFGLEDRIQHTPFPFWMFCLAWAIVAFGLVALLDYAFAAPAAVAAVGVVATPASAPTPLQPLPPRTRHRRRDAGVPHSIQTPTGVMQPGYYMLDPAGSGVPGVPRYVYIGPEGPGMPLSATAPAAPAAASAPAPASPDEDFDSGEDE